MIVEFDDDDMALLSNQLTDIHSLWLVQQLMIRLLIFYPLFHPSINARNFYLSLCLSVCQSVPCISLEPLIRLTSNVVYVLLMTRVSAVPSFVVVGQIILQISLRETQLPSTLNLL